MADASTAAERDGGVDAGPRPGTDAGIGAPTDAATESPPLSWGSACERDEDCARLCHGLDGCRAHCGAFDRCWPRCGPSLRCPDEENQTCLASSGVDSFCAPHCDIAAEDPCGPRGLGCANAYREIYVCSPGCSDDSDCTDGRQCQRTRGGGECIRLDASVGDACAKHPDGQRDSGDEQWCWVLDEASAEGICVGMNCTPASDHCERYFDPESACAIVELFPGRHAAVCVPRCGPSAACPAGLTCADQDGAQMCVRP